MDLLAAIQRRSTLDDVGGPFRLLGPSGQSMHNGSDNQPREGTMATFARCTRTDGRQVYVNLDRVLSMERFPRANLTVLGLSARLIDGETSIEVREEPQRLISESVTGWDA